MILELAMALATAVTIPTPTISYTSDSVYKEASYITTTVTQEEDSSYTLHIEKAMTLGFCIYDNPDTEQIEGVKLDDKFITDWVIPNYDPTVEHTILVKTVYTNDVAGMFAAAANGDFSKLLSNPVMLIQIIYYILAAASLVGSGIGIYKSRKNKAKTSKQIANEVSLSANASFLKVEGMVTDIFSTTVIPVIQQIQTQNHQILEALIISKSSDADSQIALIDLLKRAASDVNIEALAETTKENIKNAVAKQLQMKQSALKEVNQIIDETSTVKEESSNPKDSYGGIAI
jgi:hypothetical protein